MSAVGELSYSRRDCLAVSVGKQGRREVQYNAETEGGQTVYMSCYVEAKE